MKIILNTLMLVLFIMSTSVFAQPNAHVKDKRAEHIVVLSVPSMTCATCPITIKKALEKLPGVVQVRVNFENKTVAVCYHTKQVTVKELLNATKNVGYSSKVKTDQPKG